MRQAREAVGVDVAVGAGQLAGEHVAGVERHEADVSLVGVADGQRLDVRCQPEPRPGGEHEGDQRLRCLTQTCGRNPSLAPTAGAGRRR